MTQPGRDGHVLLDAEPDELVGMVDVETLLERVCSTLGYVPDITLRHFRQEPLRLKVMSGDDIESVALAMGVTTGFNGACRAQALFLPPRTILVPRLDWPGLLAHEFVHAIRHVTHSAPPTGIQAEHEAARIADAVT